MWSAMLVDLEMCYSARHPDSLCRNAGIEAERVEGWEGSNAV